MRELTHFAVLAGNNRALSVFTHCDTLQHTTPHCNTLQHTATHCNTLQQGIIGAGFVLMPESADTKALARLQAGSFLCCRELPRVAACCGVMQCGAVCCSVLQCVVVFRSKQ